MVGCTGPGLRAPLCQRAWPLSGAWVPSSLEWAEELWLKWGSRRGLGMHVQHLREAWQEQGKGQKSQSWAQRPLPWHPVPPRPGPSEAIFLQAHHIARKSLASLSCDGGRERGLELPGNGHLPGLLSREQGSEFFQSAGESKKGPAGVSATALVGRAGDGEARRAGLISVGLLSLPTLSSLPSAPQPRWL